MTHYRVRVRPPHSHFGLLVLSSVVGAAMAVPVVAYGWLWPYLPVNLTYRANWLWIVNVTQAAVALIPFIIFIIWFARQCQHPRWVAAAGAVYAVALTLFAMLITDLRYPQFAFHQLAEHLIVLAAAPLIGATLALGGMMIYRALGSRVIEQDGTLCQECAYPVGRSQSAACPECGEAPRAVIPTRSERCMAFLARWGCSVMLVMIGLLAVGYVMVVVAEREHRTLGASFAGEWIRSKEPVYVHEISWATAAYRHVDIGDHKAVIAIVLVHRSAFHRPDLGLRVGRLHDYGVGDPWISFGSAIVTMDVPRSALRDVLRDGPPDEAIQRMIEAAESVEWWPSDTWGKADWVEVEWPE